MIQLIRNLWTKQLLVIADLLLNKLVSHCGAKKFMRFTSNTMLDKQDIKAKLRILE